jgi:hypothetical protein
MRVYVVRLNPDPRSVRPYSKYVTDLEHDKIHGSSPMDGFEEAVNFLPEKGVVRGYLPPRNLRSMRSGEPFALITITAKTAKSGNDLVVGLQAGCIYVGERPRFEKDEKPGYRNLRWTYFCDANRSTLLEKPIFDARRLVLGNDGEWVRGPTLEIQKRSFGRFARELEKSAHVAEDRESIRKWASFVTDGSGRRSRCDLLGGIEGVVLLSPEGRKKLVTHKKGERNRGLAMAKKAHAIARDGALICEACDFEFAEFYGELGKGYGEVHHRRPIKEGERHTSLNDLAILCANCHRMIHRTEPMETVEEFRESLHRRKM